MTEHKLGEHVLKETQVKSDSGKQESVIDAAKSIWGDTPHPADTAKQGQGAPKATSLEDSPAGRGPSKDGSADQNAARHKDLKDGTGDHHTAAHTAAHTTAHRGPADQSAAGQRHGDSRAAVAADRTHHPRDGGHNPERLAEIAQKMKELNNTLHKPGGALHNSDLELVGFDKKGRLLLIDRDKGGKPEHQYLVDQESGKIVARTEQGNMKKWEPHGEGYEKPAHAEPRAGVAFVDRTSGATITKDSAGRITSICNRYGDEHDYSYDKSGKLTQVHTVDAQEKVAVYRPGTGPHEATTNLWYKQPHKPDGPDRGFTFEVKADGSLVMGTSSTERTVFGADGSITEHKGGKEKVTRPDYKHRIIEVDTLPKDKDAPKATVA